MTSYPGYVNKRNQYYFTELALGNILGHYPVNKFGAAPDGIQLTATDIWDRADATPTQQIWLAPTAARVHALVSSSAADTGFNVTVYGLKTWSTSESSEVVALTGQTPVNTANSYVIIHRMQMTPTASKTTNAGTITATAATDSTITAVIRPGNGQTEMAIYGIPSTQVAIMHAWHVNVDKNVAAAVACDFQMKYNPNPNVQTTGFLRKDDLSVVSVGTSAVSKHYTVPKKFVGPGIIKIQGISTTADLDGESGFDLELVDL